MFIKTDKQNNVLQYPYTLDMFRAENRNVSLPSALNNNLLASYGVYPVTPKEKPSFDPILEYVYPYEAPEYVDGAWLLDWHVGQKDEGWLAVELEQKKNEVRDMRADLLTKSDWVTIKAIDTNSSVSPEWSQYRQDLRDITSQTGFPWNVVWPTLPTGV